VALMSRAFLILTDSGGIQEEAPALGVPTLVLRDTSERPEGLATGAAELVGSGRERIVAAARRLLTDPVEYARRQGAPCPYGDGRAAQRIVAALRFFFGLAPDRPEDWSPGA
jgi:UDP-N-acetylglucosamine 2-epimerase (non-hydrolysing)